MAEITSVSAAFSFGSVKPDGQASETVQDSATNGDDALAQDCFLPALASAISSLSQQTLAELPNQADGGGQTCEGLSTLETADLGDAQSLDNRSTPRLEVNNVQSVMIEGSQATLIQLTSSEDFRQHGVFPSSQEEERLSVPKQTLPTDENTPLSQERPSSSTSLTLSRQPAKAEGDGTLQILGEQLHTIQPSMELADVLDASITPLTREGDGRPQMRQGLPLTVPPSARPSEAFGIPISPLLQGDGTPQARERLRAVPSSARPSEALGTPISSLLSTSNGAPQTSGERLHNAISSARPLDVHDAPAIPTMAHDGYETPHIPDEPLRTNSSAAKVADTIASLNSPFVQVESDSKQILRASGAFRNPGVAPTVERGNPQPHEIPLGKASNEPALSRVQDRLTTSTEGIASTQSMNNQGAQRRVHDVFVPTLATVSSSAILGNGERAFLYQMAKEVTNDIGRRNSSESLKGIEATAPVQALEAHEGGSLPELQPMIDVDQAAIPLADKTAMQIEANSARSQKQVTVSDANSDATNSGEEKVIPPASGSEAKAGNSGNSRSGDSEVNERPALRSVENVAAMESMKAGVVASKGRNEKAPENSRRSPIEQEQASTIADGPATESALRTSSTQIVESLEAREHSTLIVQTSNAPVNVGTKPTGSMSPELGFDARTISSLVTENLTKGISNELVQRLRDGVSELKLHLKPESLGDMTLRVRLDDEKVVAQIHVTQPDVKVALEATLPQLRDALTSRGIEVHRVDIFATGDAPTNESRGQQEAKQRLSAKRRGGDVAEERYKGARSMGYNTIEVIM